MKSSPDYCIYLTYPFEYNVVKTNRKLFFFPTFLNFSVVSIRKLYELFTRGFSGIRVRLGRGSLGTESGGRGAFRVRCCRGTHRVDGLSPADQLEAFHSKPEVRSA